MRVGARRGIFARRPKGEPNYDPRPPKKKKRVAIVCRCIRHRKWHAVEPPHREVIVAE